MKVYCRIILLLCFSQNLPGQEYSLPISSPPEVGILINTPDMKGIAVYHTGKARASPPIDGISELFTIDRYQREVRHKSFFSLYGRHLYKYDENGRIIEQHRYARDTVLMYKYEYSYNADGLRVGIYQTETPLGYHRTNLQPATRKELLVQGDTIIKTITRWDGDEEETLQEVTHLEYDEHGTLRKKELSIGTSGPVTITRYDEEGRATESQTAIFDSFEDEYRLTYNVQYEYQETEEGLVEIHLATDHKTGHKTRREFVYKNGLLTRRTSWNEEGKLSYHQENTYEDGLLIQSEFESYIIYPAKGLDRYEYH